MTWLDLHKRSEQLAADAHFALRAGDTERAHQLFREAGEAESKALEALDKSKTRTLGITAVSAVSLLFKGDDFDKAECLASTWLSFPSSPDFAKEQLRQLLQAIWTERAKHRAGVTFLPGQVVVSVSGGEVVQGGAPLDVIVGKVQVVEHLFYRTIEHLKRIPLRKRGQPKKEIQDYCRPWLFQTVPGSYQFAVAIQGPRQGHLFKSNDPKPDLVADHFLSILRATSEDPERDLPIIVPEADYREAFLKLTRNLAPTGKQFSELRVRAAGEPEGVRLEPASRAGINQALRKARPTITPEEEEHELRGVLRNLHLDDDWLEVAVEGETKRVTGLHDALDDVIGPMVNRQVVLRVLRTRRGFSFLDIEEDTN